MARRRLKDDMPAIMLRATIRTTTAAVMQYQAQSLGDRQSLATALAAAAVTVGSAALASADDRTWRAAFRHLHRARPPAAGAHSVTLDTVDGPRRARGGRGRYAVVDFRLLRQQVYVNAPRVPGASGGGQRP